MTELTRYLNTAKEADATIDEVKVIMDKLINEPVLLTIGDKSRKIDPATLAISDETFNSLGSVEAKEENMKGRIYDLQNEIDADIPYTTTKNYGNVWTFLLSKANSPVFTIDPETEDEKYNTQLEDYLLNPKISYYDSSDAFSTKREVIRSYEKIIYNTNSISDFTFSLDIFKNMNSGLYDVTTPDSYISLSIPLRYTYLHLLENNYTIFNDERDDLIRSVFNNTINYLTENDLFALIEKIAKLIIQRAKEEHESYIEELKEALKAAWGDIGSAIIDFSKLFNDVSGDYVGALGAASGKMVELVKELYENYNFDISSGKIEFGRIFRNIVTEAAENISTEGAATISSIEDLRNFEFVYLLSLFFKTADTINTPLIIGQFNTILNDAKNFRKKEANFIKAYLESPDKEKYTYTEEFLNLYQKLQK